MPYKTRVGDYTVSQAWTVKDKSGKIVFTSHYRTEALTEAHKLKSGDDHGPRSISKLHEKSTDESEIIPADGC